MVQFTRKITGPAEAKADVLKGMQEWAKKNEIKDAPMNVRWDENDDSRLIISVTITVDGNIKGEDIGKAYWEFLKRKSSSADRQVNKLTKNLVKELSASGMAWISGQELLLAIEDDLSGLEAESPAAEGSWEFTYKERSFEVHNHGDEVVFSYVRKIEGGTEAWRTAFLERIQNRTAKKKAKKATSMETIWYPSHPEWLWAKAVYQLGDGLTGKDLHAATGISVKVQRGSRQGSREGVKGPEITAPLPIGRKQMQRRMMLTVLFAAAVGLVAGCASTAGYFTGAG